MIKREIKVNFKSFIIWFSILICMFLAAYLIYPFAITDEVLQSMDEMMAMFPEEMMKAFNMDIASLSTAYGWVKSEGFVYVFLVLGLYSSIFGGSILLKEENDKTIEYLGSVPIKRSNIVTNKIIVGILYIILMVLLFGIFNYIALLISCDFNKKEFLLLSISPLLIALPFFSLNLFISTFMKKSKMILGLSLGFVFIFYMLYILSELSDKVSWLKYFSIYTLADARNIIENVQINPVMIFISLIITIILIVFTYIRYNKKELI